MELESGLAAWVQLEDHAPMVSLGDSSKKMRLAQKARWARLSARRPAASSSIGER